MERLPRVLDDAHATTVHTTGRSAARRLRVLKTLALAHAAACNQRNGVLYTKLPRLLAAVNRRVNVGNGRPRTRQRNHLWVLRKDFRCVLAQAVQLVVV